MGDSDDEYDRKRRDKFRGERAEANYRGIERPVRSRDEWPEREAWSRPRPRGDYRGPPRDRGYSPSVEPQAKRMRHDYYPPHEGFYNHYQPYHQPPHSVWKIGQQKIIVFREPVAAPATTEGGQPPMMSFKAFLAAQDDNISDSEAVEKYNDYKLEFQRQQLNEFFVAHKDDEWFRLKYHPEDSVKRKEEQLNALKKRVQVFVELLETGKLNNISVDCSRTDDLIKLLDTVVIKLEGGTETDLAVLEETPEVIATEIIKKDDVKEEKIEKTEKNKNEISVKNVDEESQKSESTQLAKDNNKEENIDKEVDDSNKLKDVSQENENDFDQTNEKNDESVEAETVDKDDEESTSSKKDVEENINGDQDEIPFENIADENGVTENTAVDNEENGNEQKNENKRKRSFSGSESSSSSSSESDHEDDKAEEKKEICELDSSKEDGDKVSEVEEGEEENEKKTDLTKTEVPDIKKTDPPRALHKTTSIFLRNLAPTITRQEVEAMCSRYSGFLRVALADPQPERRWLRRGWVTFTRNANIKEICWNLNNIRLRDCELGAIVNRDLSRRIRQVNGIVAHKQIVRSDIRISAKVTLHLDNKANLWIDEINQKPEQESFGLVSNNPVLKNITDYLIEEASAEEEELLGLESTSEQQDTTSSIVDRDENLIKVLDKIIFYLRIVHSVDYYNHCEYPNEDEMPNRCGILHARGPPPLTKTDMSAFMGNVIEAKMSHFLPDKPSASSSGDSKTDKLVQLALKDEQAELDKFVLANTRELAKDKWLCPLSGKKFKGPDFVRKHIFNKHAEKVEEVKKEVQFFNNYLRDPKRPMVAEQQPVKREEQPPYTSHPVYGNLYGYSAPRGGYYNQGYAQRSRGYPRSRGGGDFRPVVHYRDLDAPREPEEFI